MELQDTEKFFKNLRDANKVNYDTQVNLLNEQRRQQQQSIMSQANKAGVVYSNFPQRSMLQFDTNTYLPAFTKLATSYQTGLDSLRAKGTQIANNIKRIQEAISDLDQDVYMTI